MKLTIKNEEKLITVLIKGDLVKETAEEFKSSVRKELHHGNKPVLVNLDKLSHIDSHGFDVLGSLMNAANNDGLGFAIFVSDDAVHKTLQDSPYYEFLPIHTDESKAHHEALRPRKGKK